MQILETREEGKTLNQGQSEDCNKCWYRLLSWCRDRKFPKKKLAIQNKMR